MPKKIDDLIEGLDAEDAKRAADDELERINLLGEAGKDPTAENMADLRAKLIIHSAESFAREGARAQKAKEAEARGAPWDGSAKQEAKKGGKRAGSGRRKGPGFFKKNDPGVKAYSKWEKANSGLFGALGRAKRDGVVDVGGERLSEEQIADRLATSMQQAGRASFNLNDEDERTQTLVMQRKLDDRLRREGFFTRSQKRREEAERRRAEDAQRVSPSKSLVPYVAPKGLVAGKVTGSKSSGEYDNVFVVGGRSYKHNKDGRRDPIETRDVPEGPGRFAGARQRAGQAKDWLKGQRTNAGKGATSAGRTTENLLDKFDDFADRRTSRLARRPGIVATFIGALRIYNQKARLLVVFGLAVGLLFIPYSFFTFAGWSIAAAAMVLISALYFGFLNLIKAVASAFVAAINALFSAVGGLIVSATEQFLSLIGAPMVKCDLGDTDVHSRFCSGREILAEGFIPASELNALNIPLLDPRHLMPTLGTETLFEVIGRKTGLFNIDLGSFFAKMLGTRFQNFVQTADIGWVIAVFLVPTIIIGVVLYVNFIQPALKDAGVIGRA